MGEHTNELNMMKESYENITPPEEGISLMKDAISRAKAERQRRRKKRIAKAFGWGAAAAAAILIAMPNLSPDVAYAMSNVPILKDIVEVVEFSRYEEETSDARFSADVTVPRLVACESEIPRFDGQLCGDMDHVNLYDDALNSINMEMDLISNGLVRQFQENMERNVGYEDLIIRYEILGTTEDYFTVKLITYVGSGSGYERDYFYTIGLESGKRISLEDLFIPGSDYQTRISDNIKAQMREQMAENDEIVYWLADSEYGDIDEWNFETIDRNQNFYINEDGQIVIAFSEGDVGPMAMGTTEFVIPNEVTAQIRLK